MDRYIKLGDLFSIYVIAKDNQKLMGIILNHTVDK